MSYLLLLSKNHLPTTPTPRSGACRGLNECHTAHSQSLATFPVRRGATLRIWASKMLTPPLPKPPERMFWKTLPVGPITKELTATFPYSRPNPREITGACGPSLTPRPAFSWTEYGVFRGRTGVYHLKRNDSLHLSSIICLIIIKYSC